MQSSFVLFLAAFDWDFVSLNKVETKEKLTYFITKQQTRTFGKSWILNSRVGAEFHRCFWIKCQKNVDLWWQKKYGIEKSFIQTHNLPFEFITCHYDFDLSFLRLTCHPWFWPVEFPSDPSCLRLSSICSCDLSFFNYDQSFSILSCQNSSSAVKCLLWTVIFHNDVPSFFMNCQLNFGPSVSNIAYCICIFDLSSLRLTYQPDTITYKLFASQISNDSWHSYKFSTLMSHSKKKTFQPISIIQPSI